MASQAGLKPATCPLGGGCSIQLSYWDTLNWRAILKLSGIEVELARLCQDDFVRCNYLLIPFDCIKWFWQSGLA